MIDSLYSNLEKSKSSDILNNLNIFEKEYCVLTLHRPVMWTKEIISYG